MPEYTTHGLRGHGEVRINQDLRAREIKVALAHEHEAGFRVPSRRPAPLAPAEAGGNFDTRTPHIRCDDVKFAAAAYRSAAEHYDNAPFWKRKLHEQMGGNTADRLRAEAVRELDVLHEPTPPVASPGITNRGGEAMRPETGPRGSSDYGQAAQQGFEPRGRLRAIGGGHSVPSWDAYTTVTAPFATPALVHAPESDAATRVVDSGTARLAASTFYAAGALSNVRPSASLRPVSSTTGPLVAAAAHQPAGAAFAGGSAGAGPAPPGGFSSTLENALRNSVNRDALLPPVGEADARATSRGSPRAASRGDASRKGARVDLRDDHVLHALTSQASAAHSTDAQRKLLSTRGLPISAHVDVVDGSAIISAAPHAGSVRALAAAQGEGDFGRTFNLAGDLSARHSHRAHAVPPRRFDQYGNVLRADIGLKPQWIQHTAAAESSAEMFKPADAVPVEPQLAPKYRAATARLGGFAREAAHKGEGERRIKLRVWTGSSEVRDVTAAGAAASVLDDPQWQKTFFARQERAVSAGRAGGGQLDAAASLSPPDSASSGEQQNQHLARLQQEHEQLQRARALHDASMAQPPEPLAQPHRWQQPREARASAAPTIEQDLAALLRDTALPGPPGRHQVLDVDRSAALRSRGASRQRVREDEDESRFPAASAAVDADAARGLVNQAIATSHPFLARQREVAFAREVQARHASIPRARNAPGALAGARAETAAQAIAGAVRRGGGGTTTVLLESRELAAEDSAVPSGRPLRDATVRRTAAPHRASSVEALLAVPLPGSPAHPRSQQVPSLMHETRADRLSLSAALNATTRTLRTSHSRGTGAGANTHGAHKGVEEHDGWLAFMTKGATVPRADSYGPGHERSRAVTLGPRAPTMLGALQEGIEYAFPFKVRNQTPFARRFQVAAAGLDDVPSAPRGVLHVRAKNLPVAPGLSFTCVVVVSGLEPGTLRGTVQLRSDDGQHFSFTIAAHVLDEARFLRSRDDARATGRLDVLRSFTDRMDTIARQWDDVYSQEGPVSAEDAATLAGTGAPAGGRRAPAAAQQQQLRPAAPASSGSSTAGGGDGSGNGGGEGGDGDAERAQAALAAAAESGFAPALALGAGDARLEAAVAELLEGDGGAEIEGDTPYPDEYSHHLMGHAEGVVDEAQSTADRQRSGGHAALKVVTSRDGGQQTERAASPTSTLLRLASSHGTTPGELLSQAIDAGLPRHLASQEGGADGLEFDAVAANSVGGGHIGGVRETMPPALPTITSNIVAMTMSNNEPAYIVGSRVITPMHVDAVPYPEPAATISAKIAGLQLRAPQEQPRGKVLVGGGASALMRRRQLAIDREPSLVEAHDAAAEDGWRASAASPRSQTDSPMRGSGGGGSGGGGISGRAKEAAAEAAANPALHPDPQANLNDTVEPRFTTIFDRPTRRVGPQTAKLGPSAQRALADDARYGRAGTSEIMRRGADFVVPHGGTHALVVPIV